MIELFSDRSLAFFRDTGKRVCRGQYLEGNSYWVCGTDGRYVERPNADPKKPIGTASPADLKCTPCEKVDYCMNELDYITCAIVDPANPWVPDDNGGGTWRPLSLCQNCKDGFVNTGTKGCLNVHCDWPPHGVLAKVVKGTTIKT